MPAIIRHLKRQRILSNPGLSRGRCSWPHVEPPESTPGCPASHVRIRTLKSGGMSYPLEIAYAIAPQEYRNYFADSCTEKVVAGKLFN
jgi:hypothetical protein